MKKMGKTKQTIGGFTLVEIALVLVILTGLCLSGYFLFSGQHKTNKQVLSTNSATSTNTTTSSSSSAYTVLSPATVPSKTAECSQQISFSSNGDSGPITCSSGGLNVLEWNALAALEPKVMALGYGATPAQIQSALCSDVRVNISNTIELTTYQISSLYYDWSFTTDPSVVLTNGTCVNEDD